MTDDRDQVVVEREAVTPRWVGLAVVALTVLSLAGLGMAWSATSRAKNLEQNLASQGVTTRQSQDVLGQRLQQDEERNAQMAGELNVVTDRLKLTQTELSSARQQAKTIKAQDAKELAQVQTTLQTTFNTQLATKASTDDVSKLGTDVNGVKTDLDSTKENLQMARGEMGTLIARNHDEIDTLRRLGERDYFEFTLDNKGSKQKVGEMQVELRGTNVKKNQFTLALYVDDMRLEKKNRSVNEPIYFLTRGAHRPLELVVNEVRKNKVSGYVSVPKGTNTTTTSAEQGSGN
jgi:hypothetical protein